MKTEYLFAGIFVLLVVIAGFQVYSMLGLTKKISSPTTAATASQIKLPSNIQSSAPMQFKSFEEEVEYYKKNAKNPNNINIEKAVSNMDSNLDGVCDSCGMAILHCIESGMENM
ncbi:MAG TPA: hypothetical protein VI612_04965 [Candidatus Nanoarchaeia archaeon]|nr:hypothetical protein [Candidatus Nanoarchaeia archaeon]